MTEPSAADGPPAEEAVGRLKVSVRVIGDALDPAEVTRILGVEPSFAARKGERARPGRLEVVQRTGAWVLRAEQAAGWPLDEAIHALLAQLPSDAALWRSLGERFRLDVFCGMFMGTDNQGLELRPETLQLLAARGLRLGLDVYGPPPGGDAV